MLCFWSSVAAVVRSSCLQLLVLVNFVLLVECDVMFVAVWLSFAAV